MPLEEAIAAAFTKFAESSLGDNKPANIEDTTGDSFILADFPSNSITPQSGFIKPAIICSKVLFPEPLLPTIVNISCVPNLKETSLIL